MNGEHEKINEVSALLASLREGEQPRDVYKGRGGGYCVTYGGGEVAAATVREAVKLGEIAETYPGEGLEFWRLPVLVGRGDVARRRDRVS